MGDDIIEFKPSTANQSSNLFDAQFALVKIGDIVTINYGSIEVQFVIREKKYIQNGSNKKYAVRIAGKNLQYSTTAVARIDKPLFNNNKYGVLAVAAANNNSASIPASLIVGTARGAQALGIGFNPDLFDAAHYLLYLALYPDGNPADGYTVLPPVDVTGNQGATPGLYTLDSIVAATNNAFRQAGYNYRFIAFQYQGEFGIMLADSYNNAGFSILNGVVTPNGTFDSTATPVTFINNVVGVIPVSAGFVAPDPLGFSIGGANIASPPYQASYASAEAALLPTKIFLPLKRNNFYVNGTEREKLNIDVGQIIDGYGDGYWIGSIISQTVIPGPSPTGRVETTYSIPLDLSASQLKVGKTLVVQSFDGYGSFPVDFGRFIIQSLSLPCAGISSSTQITVYDAVHGTGISPVATVGVGAEVAIYFSSDSVSINQENSSDYSAVSPFKRHIEIYIDDNSNTFTQERGRFYIGNSSPLIVNGNVPLFSYSELAKLNVVKISPKLRGYQFGSVNKITLNMINYDTTTGIFDGYLSSWDGVNPVTNVGPTTFGKRGEITRFYDETNVDYLDIVFDINTAVSTFSMQQLDFQLFPSLSLDNEQMLIATCQYNDVSTSINYVKDERQFGNIGIKELSTSALQFLSLPERLLHGNGVIRGFDLQNTVNPNGSQIYLMGGEVLVNGNFVQMDATTVNIPLIKEFPLYNVNWLLCINQQGEYQPIPLLDYDPVVGTPNNPTRLFLALNLNNGQTYNLDATTFSDLINKRKDLVPLYIVTSITVPGSGATLPTITLSLSDVRKYVNDIDTNLALRLTSSTAQGNFRNPTSILNWIKYNNLFNGTAILGGANATVTTPVVLSFVSDVLIDGRDNATLTLNSPATIGSNLAIKNLTINFNGGITVNSNTTNVLFDNCVINITVPTNSPPSNVIFDMTGASKITFRNSIINVTYTSLYDNTQVFRGSVFRFTNSNNITFDSVILDVIYNVSPGLYTPGNIFTLVNSVVVKITNSVFSGNFNQFVNNSLSNFVTLQNLTVTSTYNPNAGTSPDSYNGVSYSSADWVNSGQGYIYSNVSSTLTDIQIDNVNFNYQPSVPDNDRYSFINFELSSTNSFLGTVRITNCKFNNLNIGTAIGSVDDYRAAISIINTAPASVAAGFQPILFNILIDQNVCNRNQSIIVTSKTSSGNMVYPGLGVYNCYITNNFCGTIGYWISAGYKVINLIPNGFNDKSTNLCIANNTCHYISNLDHTGHYFLVSKIVGSSTVDQSAYPSGYVKIDSNKANWIHTGIAFEENSSLHITNNVLSAYDTLYVFNFNDGYPNAAYNPSFPLALSPGYAIFVSSNKHVANPAQTPGEGSDSACVITGNVTDSGYFFQLGFIPFTYQYPIGYIYCQSSCNISGNSLKGIAESNGFDSLILLGGRNSNVTNNRVYKGTTSVFAYVTYAQFELPSATGAESTGIVKNNFFDGYSTNSTVFLPTLVNLSLASGAKRWLISDNINQSVVGNIPLLESTSYNYSYFQASPNIANTINPQMANYLPGFITTIAISSGYPSGTNADPRQAQVYQRGFLLNNYLPTNTARILKLDLTMTNNTASGIIFDDTGGNGPGPGANEIDLTITNMTTSASQTIAIGPDSAFNVSLGAAGSSYTLEISSATIPAFSFLDYNLGDQIFVQVSVSINAKEAGAPNPTDVLSIGPLKVTYMW